MCNFFAGAVLGAWVCGHKIPKKMKKKFEGAKIVKKNILFVQLISVLKHAKITSVNTFLVGPFF